MVEYTNRHDSVDRRNTKRPEVQQVAANEINRVAAVVLFRCVDIRPVAIDAHIVNTVDERHQSAVSASKVEETISGLRTAHIVDEPTHLILSTDQAPGRLVQT